MLMFPRHLFSSPLAVCAYWLILPICSSNAWKQKSFMGCYYLKITLYIFQTANRAIQEQVLPGEMLFLLRQNWLLKSQVRVSLTTDYNQHKAPESPDSLWLLLPQRTSDYVVSEYHSKSDDKQKQNEVIFLFNKSWFQNAL